MRQLGFWGGAGTDGIGRGKGRWCRHDWMCGWLSSDMESADGCDLRPGGRRQRVWTDRAWQDRRRRL